MLRIRIHTIQLHLPGSAAIYDDIDTEVVKRKPLPAFLQYNYMQRYSTACRMYPQLLKDFSLPPKTMAFSACHFVPKYSEVSISMRLLDSPALLSSHFFFLVFPTIFVWWKCWKMKVDRSTKHTLLESV